MRITASQLESFGLVDEVLEEPLGGAHRDPKSMAGSLEAAIGRHLDELADVPADALLEKRQQRLDGFGAFREA